MKTYFIIFMLVAAGASLKAQDSSTISVFKDPRIDALIKKQIAINDESTRDARRNIPGYRLQIISTSDRNTAIKAKATIYEHFPELKPYLVYLAPYFRLRVGNFREKEEANDYKRELSKYFPNGISIVRDIIVVQPDKPEIEN
jgi:hypothetical protein